ncbi:MAG: O-phosphoseryl-tRNA(Sec) selenium transferase [Candidatus Lokiarchaeota archaeon]|nr:O-phosphoseryl-tRNA(Sec) selenium transferase [Candidatus Lokiarchaeota archaeon]
MIGDLNKLLKGFIPENMLERGLLVLDSNLNPIKTLFEHRKIPEEGWNDEIIEFLLKIFNFMDTDKDPKAIKVGEREARTSSPLVSDLSSGFCHGIGRSGKVSAAQPKAPGSSIMYQLANKLALDALNKFGLPNIKDAIIFPFSTGMALGLSCAAARNRANKTKILYPRLDHNSPLKGMDLVGIKPKIIPSTLDSDVVYINPDDIAKEIDEKVLGIVSTTTFFPPRTCDDVKKIAKIAKENDVFHIINNAYGAQSKLLMKKIQGAIDAGRVDAIIQSTDKNFLTPIGGSIVGSPSKEFLEEINQCYPGRASAAPVVQFLTSILSLGVNKYNELRIQQENNRKLLEDLLKDLMPKYGERVLEVENPIACATTIDNYDPLKLGGGLYSLRVTGPRAFQANSKWGTCHDNYPHSYLVINAAIGSSESDIRDMMEKLKKIFSQLKIKK